MRELLSEVLSENRYFIGCCFWFLIGSASMAVLLVAHVSRVF